MTLDRINNDGNYEPRNCRWATAAEQHANRPKQNRPRPELRKPVRQIALDGRVITEFASGLLASEKTGIMSASISAVCTGKRATAGGFKWQHI